MNVGLQASDRDVIPQIQKQINSFQFEMLY